MSKAFESQSIDSDFSPNDQSAAKQGAFFHAQGCERPSPWRCCGQMLSGAISHPCFNSASTKSRLSRVSEGWERASVYLK